MLPRITIFHLLAVATVLHYFGLYTFHTTDYAVTIAALLLWNISIKLKRV